MAKLCYIVAMLARYERFDRTRQLPTLSVRDRGVFYRRHDGARGRKAFVAQTIFDLPLEAIRTPVLVIGHAGKIAHRNTHIIRLTA